MPDTLSKITKQENMTQTEGKNQQKHTRNDSSRTQRDEKFPEIKNTLDGIKTRLDTEEKTGGLEDTATENI